MDVEQDLRILESPAEITELMTIKSRIFRKVKNLDVTITESKEPLSFDNKIAGQREIKQGSLWGGPFSCAWFHITGDIPKRVKDKKLCVIFDICAEALIYDREGNPVVGISNPLSIPSTSEFLNPPEGKTFVRLNNCSRVDLWADAGFNGMQGKEMGCGMLKKAELAVIDEEVYDYYFDFLAVEFAKVNYKGRENIEAGKALNASYRSFLVGHIKKARLLLAPLLNKPSESRLNITAVGHSHLDLAWLWPIRETKRKAARTLSNALVNMEQYPEYIYGASQPQEFQWIKDLYPTIYEKMVKACKEGRFEPQGGMWVECDTNIPCGESLIRQFYYGKKFWKDEFGFDVKNCWLPDVFGYTAALPQIMKKCGMDYFMTQKLSWNEHNEFPLETFHWEGLSDDRVLVHLLPGNTYSSSCAAPSLRELEATHRKKDITDEALMLYGAGDGGGGPCQANIELIKRYKNMAGVPKVKFGRACDFFEEVDSKNYQFPAYKGELYLEKHQGTYTTQSNTKKNNNACEKQLHNLEALGAAAMLKGVEYPYEKAEEIWKEVLLYQFHDILPGSSIERVYKENGERYKILLSELNDLQYSECEKLDHVKAKTAMNLTSFSRKGYLKNRGEWYKYSLEPYSADKIVPAAGEDFSMMKSNGISMESDIFVLFFSEEGDITSVKDKRTGREYVHSYINALDIYDDKKLYFNAWDIDIDYYKQTPEKLHRTSFRSYVDGAEAVTENYFSYGSSSIVQKVVLRKGVPYVEFRTAVSWHETHKMLRADFIPRPFSDSVTCDIQFGNISRSTKQETKKDWAQFEICAHKYVDVSDEKCGTAVLSDAKYGFRVKDRLISLNLLRSPVYPDKNADRGYHEIRYAFYPHEDSCFEASVPEYAYDFNYKVPVSHVKFGSLISTDSRNIIVETLKPAEDGKGIIIRLYENEGRDTESSVEFGFKYKKLYEADMTENLLGETDKKLTFKPYEIKTLYAEL